MKVLDDAMAHYNFETKQELLKYDFDFWAWPIDFRISSIEKRDKITFQNLESSNRTVSLAVPCRILSYIIANNIALKLIYPGSVQIINWAMS